jgi:hypothetical protein
MRSWVWFLVLQKTKKQKTPKTTKIFGKRLPLCMLISSIQYISAVHQPIHCLSHWDVTLFTYLFWDVTLTRHWVCSSVEVCELRGGKVPLHLVWHNGGPALGHGKATLLSWLQFPLQNKRVWPRTLSAWRLWFCDVTQIPSELSSLIRGGLFHNPFSFLTYLHFWWVWTMSAWMFFGLGNFFFLWLKLSDLKRYWTYSHSVTGLVLPKVF